MGAEHPAKRLVEEVSRGVVRHRREADAPGNDGPHAVAFGEPLTGEDERLVVAEAMPRNELRPRAVPLDPALIRDLAPTLGVERRLAELREERALFERKS